MSASYNLYGTNCLNDDLISIEINCTQEEYGRINRAINADTLIGTGLTDLQVNGYKGVDFNDTKLSIDQVKKITLELLQEGVTSYLPTLITDSPENINEKIKRIITSRVEDPLVGQCIKGIHLEGPFISSEDGPRGAHPEEFILRPDWALFNQWQEIAKGNIRLITVSPEWPESLDFIEKCVDSGVKVAIGHTSCAPEKIHEAVNAGATLSTHLGNGMHKMIPRFPNYLWSQLAEDSLYASVIGDGFHLPDDVLKVFFRVKQEKLFLISDSVALGGMPPGEYNQHIGGKVLLSKEGRLYLKNDPTKLAGSVFSLRKGIEHIIQSGLCDLKTAWEMASLKPLKFLGMEPEKKDRVVFNVADDGTIKIICTLKQGKLM